MSDQTETVQLPDYALKLVHDVAVQEGFVDGSYTFGQEAGSKQGDGFQGIMIRIHYDGKRQNSTDRLTVLLKMTPISPIKRAVLGTNETFSKEVLAYRTILPAIHDLQTKHGLTKENGFFAVPKCYGTYANESTGDFVIIMQDIRELGFEMVDKFNPLDVDHAVAVMQQLGRFHAVSMALQRQQPDVFEQFKHLTTNALKSMARPESAQMYQAFFGMVTASLDGADDFEPHIVAKVKELSSDYHEKLKETMRPDGFEPFGVINHADIWSNNLMYLYGGDKKLKEVCLLDWQNVQYGSPICDVAIYMYGALQQEIRGPHYDALLKAYHQSVSETLGLLGEDASSVFSWTDFQKQLHNYARFGLIMSVTILMAMTMAPADMPDFDDIDLADVDSAQLMMDNSKFNERMRAAIREFFKHDYLL